MFNSGGAIAALAKQNRQHGMAGGVVGIQLKHTLQERNRGNVAGLVFQLGRAFQSREVVRRDLERAAKRSQGFLLTFFTRERDPLQRP